MTLSKTKNQNQTNKYVNYKIIIDKGKKGFSGEAKVFGDVLNGFPTEMS